MVDVKVRESKESDRENILRVYNKAISSSDGYSDRQERILKVSEGDLPDKLYKEDGNTTFVAEYETDVVGWISLNKNHGILDGLFVHPNYHSMGIGSELIDKMESEAFESGIRRIIVASNPHVTNYYRNKGYSVVRETEMSGMNTEEKVSCIVLVKKLF